MLDFKSLKPFNVIYNHGYGDRPRKVYALDIEDAAKVGLAEFRRNTDQYENVDFSTLSEVVKDVISLID